ncbi:cAMP-dependent protein kinase catalytic subunit PRKX [Tupaia chinensis]|uniref:cAMP-dependent protein kinase catalytic subunit PRKX n=1 Tax=Tupaia chinensis TaxID=246437 RepID=UPI000FFC914B|nr:cAMP-dependent protein kinase catalytic subunit PRKX [Tupaia chinensis]
MFHGWWRGVWLPPSSALLAPQSQPVLQISVLQVLGCGLWEAWFAEIPHLPLPPKWKDHSGAGGCLSVSVSLCLCVLFIQLRVPEESCLVNPRLLRVCSDVGSAVRGCRRGLTACVCPSAGTGTFGRVHLVKEKAAKHFYALKIMSIPDVIRLKQEQHVHNEKSVLKEVSHPFLVRLFWTWHDERCLYMLMEYVPGGELFSYLRNRGRFAAGTGLFYSAEIVCALEYLHAREIVYRDLKPENILLDRDGHIKLTDFGFAKKLVDRTWTLCGTPEYLAPEVIQSKGHGRAVDWWALGILIFEMLSGFPPFFDDNPFGIYQKILAGKIDFPRHLDFSVKDLIKKLLVVDRTRRLGNMKNGANDVKRHRWFRSVDWEAVPQRKLKPPILPKISGDGDTSNFETYPENEWNSAPPVPQKDLDIFKNF